MSYFSNHSQSRFLANSNSTTVTSSPIAPPSNARSRLPTSKHFSTSVSSSGDEKSSTKDNGASGGGASSDVHPLKHTWIFWFRAQRTPGNKIVSYEEGIKKITAFGSAESFWSLWTHLQPPSALAATTDYLLFHRGIVRPVWEDPLNITGGKWILRLKKGVADRVWEDLVLAIVGDQFAVDEVENGEATVGEWPEICGCTISVRPHEDIVSLWNRFDGDPRVKDRIRDTMKRVLNLPPTTVIEYKSNNDSMNDKSSFRSPALMTPKEGLA